MDKHSFGGPFFTGTGQPRSEDGGARAASHPLSAKYGPDRDGLTEEDLDQMEFLLAVGLGLVRLER